MKKKIIFLSIFILVIIIGGVGIYYFTQSSKAPITFAETEAKYKTYTEPAPTDGSLPTDHDAYSNIAYVLWVLEHTEHYSSETRGSAVSVGQEQVIYNHRTINGDTQLVDTVSSGVVTVGKQKYFKDGKVLLRDYVSQDGDNITWQNVEPECISYNGYIKRYGWLPSQATGYIICKDTILEISEVKELEGGLYSIHLSLNPGDDYAPFWYRREVATNASSLTVPEFSSIEIEYVFDATWHVQEVHTQEKYNVTPKVAPIKASCTTNITETFDYEQYDFSSDAMDFFTQYENMVPVDGPVDVADDATPLSYITGSLMGGNPEKTFQLKILVKEKVITGDVLLNISDLNHIIVKAKFDDLFVVYDGDVVYLSYKDLKVKTTIEEASNLIKPLLEQMPSNNANQSEATLNLAQIMNDINGAVVTKQDQNVQLDMSLNLGFITLPLIFDITEQENNLTLNSIESTIEFSGMTANIHLNKSENVVFPTIHETEFESLESVEFIVDDLVTILSNQLVGVKGQYVFDEQYRIDYDITIHFNQPIQIQAYITIHDQMNHLNETIRIHYVDSMIYLNYQNVKIKFSLEEIEQLFGKQMEMPTLEKKPLDIPTIVDKILSIDYATLIQTISLKENLVHVSLDLSEVMEKLSLLDMTIKNTENGFDLQINSALSLSVLSSSITDILLNKDEYSPIHEYFEEIDYLLGLINKESIQLKLDGSIKLNETTTIGLNGEVYFYLKDGAYQIKGNVIVTYGEKNIEVGIVKIGQELYVELLGQTILIHLDNLEKTIQTIQEKLNLTMPSLTETGSMDWNQLIQFISSIKIESNQISCDLSVLKEGLGTCSLAFNLGQDLSFNLVIEKLVSLNGTIGSCDYQEITQPTGTLEDEELIQLLDYVENIEQILEKKQVSGTFTGAYEAYTLNGTYYVDFKEVLKAKVELNFITPQETLPITIYYDESSIYVEINQIKVKLTVEELMELIEKYGNSDNQTGLRDIVNELDIKEMIESLTVENGTIEVVLTGLSKLISMMDQMTIRIERTPEEIKILTDYYQIGLTINHQENGSYEVIPENYQSLSELKESIEYILDRVYKKNLHIHLSGSYELALTEQKELVEVNGDINLVLTETNTYDIEADITLSIKGINIRIVYIHEKLYVTYEENTIGLTKAEIQEWLEPIMSQPLSLEGNTEDLVNKIIGILQKLELRNGNEIRMDSSAWQIGIQEILISLALGETGLGITIQGDQLLNVEILIDETPKEIVEPVESLTNEDIKSYKEIVDYLLGLINKESIQLKLDGSIELNETTTIGLNGEVYFYLKDGAYQIKGNVIVTYGEKNIEVGIVKIGQELYVELLGQTILIHLDNLEKTIQTIQEKLNLTMPSLTETGSMDWNQLIQFISSIKIESNQISCDLSVLKEGLGTCSLAFNLGQDLSFNLVIEKLVSLNGTIGSCDYQEITQPTVTLEDEELIQLLDYVENIEQILEKKQVSGTFTGAYEAYTLNGTYYVDFKEALKAKVELNFITPQETLPITIYYDESSIYVEINQIKVKLTVEELMELIEKYGNSDNQTGLQDIVNELDIKGMIESLTVENGTMEVVLTGLSKLISMMDQMTIRIERTPEEIKILTDYYQIGFTINNQENVSYEIIPENYQSLSELKESIEYILDRVYKKNLHIHLSGSYELALTEQKELVEVNGDINLVLTETNTYDIEADITLSIKGINIRIVYIHEKLYVTYEENTIGLTKAEIQEWLEPIMSQPLSLEGNTEDLVNKIIGILQKLELRNGNKIRIDSSAWQIGIQEILISLALGEVGLGITLQGDQLLNVEILIDETSKEIVEPVESLTNEDIKSYKEIVDYLLGLINKESMRVALSNGTISFITNGQQEQILLDGTIDLMYHNNSYQIKVDLHLEGFEYSGDITIIYKDHCIYLTLFGQNMELPIDQLPEVLSTIEEQFGVMFTMNKVDTNLDLSLLSVLIKTNGIELDLSELIQTVCCISFSYQFQNDTLNEELINRVLEGNLSGNYDNIEISLPYTLTKIETADINVPTDSVLMVTDILDWIKMAGYGWNLVKDGKVNVQIDPFDVVLKDGQKITISGAADIILTQNTNQWSYQVEASLAFEGFGMKGSTHLVIIEDDIYLSVAGIRVHLNLQEMNSLIQDIQEILKPMLPQMNFTMPTLEANGACINGIFSLVGHEFKVSLQPIFGELINLGLVMNLLTLTDKDALDLQLNLEMSELVIEEMHMILTASDKTEILPINNCLEAEELKELARTIVQAYELKDRKEFKFSIETNVITNDSKVAHLFGKIYLKLINSTEFDAKVDLEVTEFDQNGSQSAWHQVHLNIISLTTLQDSNAISGMMYGTYGNNEASKDAVIKIKSSYSGLEDLIASITELMNIDLGGSLDLPTSSTSFNLDDFIQKLQVSSNEITLSLNPMNLFPAMNETNAEIITFRIKKNADSIQGVEIDNLYLSYVYEDSTMKLDTLLLDFISDEMQLVVPTDIASYYDISNMSYLVDALYHNALEKSFRLQGNVSLKALSFDIKVPVDIQIKVKDSGEPDIYAFIDMSNIGIADNPLYRIATKKRIYIYYKDQFVYIYRDDVDGTANDAKIKIHYSEFMDNITYYLTDFAMGLHKDILDAMNKNDKKGDGFVDASLCVNNVEMTHNTFTFDLNMAEIGDNASLGNLVASLTTEMVAKTDENGNYILDETGAIVMVPMITKLAKFNFNLVNVIDLNSTDLKLTNIVLDNQNNLVVQEIDLATSSTFESYITEFDNKYLSDTIYRYQNNDWVATSKVTHKAVFNMGDAGTIVMRYEEGNPVEFPYAVGDVIAVETESGKEYYLLDGWYSDASRLNEVTIHQVMGNSSLYYYAKVHLATVALTITSDYVGNIDLVTYEGADITSLLNETYNIYTAENGDIYRFTGLTYSDGSSFDMTSVPLENAALTAHWELAQYDFSIQYGNDSPIVITKDDTSVILSESAAILEKGVYYIYSKEILTPQYLLTNYAHQFILENEQFIMKLYSLDSLSTQDELYRVDFTAPETFKASHLEYSGFFLRKDGSILVSDLLPNEKDPVRYFEINAWVDAQNQYYSWQDVNTIRRNIVLTAYVSSISSSSSTDSVFGYSESALYSGGLEISSLKVTTLSTLIFPRFVHYNGEYKTITNIKEESFINSGKTEYKSPFTGNTALQKIVFNDGLMKIGGNAFKNCTALKEVYIPASVTTIASDAFYFTEGNNWGKNPYAQNLKLHFIYDDTQAISFDYNANELLAFYDLFKNHYYKQLNCIQENKQYLVDVVLGVIA